MWDERDPKINGAQWPVIHYFIQILRKVGKLQIFIYETRRGLQVWQREAIRIATNSCRS